MSGSGTSPLANVGRKAGLRDFGRWICPGRDASRASTLAQIDLRLAIWVSSWHPRAAPCATRRASDEP